MLETTEVGPHVAHLEAAVATLTSEREHYKSEREQYKKLYLEMLERCRKLELGILGQKRERFVESDAQVTLSLLEALLSGDAMPAETMHKVRAHTRVKPTGRKPLPETLPRVDVEIVPPEVEQKGRDAFEHIGEDVSETVEHRPASIVVVRVHKPKFVLRERDRRERCEVVQASPPELPIERGLAGPGLLADTIVKRWQDHLPLYRQERIYARDGFPVARSTICEWHMELGRLVQPLVEAMWTEALTAPYLCIDATGVLVQAIGKCRSAHFFVVVAPDQHVLFGYSKKHNAAAVDVLLVGYEGYLVADAHVVYDHVYATGKVKEVGCRVGGEVALPAPHRSGRADFPHPVLHVAGSLAAA